MSRATGRRASRALSIAVPEEGYYVSSNEPKALQTLQEMARGQYVATDAGFCEVQRPYRWSDDYRQQARAYIEGICHNEWEPHAHVLARFDAAVARHASVAAVYERTLIVGTHGLAPTVWLASRLPLLPSPADFWAALTFPDLIDVDLVNKTAERRRF
ncbi:hypothetical protein [Micromonospora sp. NPDC047527]|uniref:hypothetical protein n=1 Tax=Micromonospora sp. NPDC047527 TaxID=3155144 RepID=UPI003400E69A